MRDRGLTPRNTLAPLRILYVAYPLLPVTDDSCGGAEQMLRRVEAEMASRGHLTAVAACDGSQAEGVVFVTGGEARESDCFEQRDSEHHSCILELLHKSAGKRSAFDLVHDKSGSFWRSAGEIDCPVLATLHLSRNFYSEESLKSAAPNVYFNCVSEAQYRTFRDIPNVIGTVRNGIDCRKFPFVSKKKDFLLWAGRICEEKGPQLAIEVAQRTGLPLVIMGQVYPFSYHQRFYTERIRPHLGGSTPPICFVETPSMRMKLKLLSEARALLVPSLAEETSSLVSMEAMACGTPVIAFRRGAIPEVVVHEKTGFVVSNVGKMADAVWRTGDINPHACRVHVEVNYSASHMASQYEQLYQRVLQMHFTTLQSQAA